MKEKGLGRTRHGWGTNIKVDRNELWYDVGWIKPAENWAGTLRKAVSHRFIKLGNVLTISTVLSF
jgi:hypothetical protein